ncbi:ROK family protein [Chengkuizengella axinellae]|uniref:ROK family protein n=1 Tax=Chengkuizengella axinellae TaxID=3064388 RepID=A0ABT9IZP1_9BACL|nr:ROK family protein [Chengkuizengella sp. 2205SS18-9]MDP5274822.1 ROK family protein [Chengkuizengella sp. 2205SS18-9]
MIGKILNNNSVQFKMKQSNKSLILNLLLTNGQTTRKKLAALTNLTAATITNLTNELINEQLIVEVGTAESKVVRKGPKSIILDLNPTHWTLGIHIRMDRMEIGFANLKGKAVKVENIPFSANMAGNQLLDFKINKIMEYIQKNAEITAVSIGVVTYGLMKDDRRLALVKQLERQFHLPVYMDHHVRAMTIAERMFGSYKDSKHFLVVYIGQGIGSGLTINGQVYSNEASLGNQLGHMVYMPNGKPCKCGQRGCIEQYVSEKLALEELNCSSIAAIIEKLKNNDEDCIHVLTKYGQYLGTVISSFIHMIYVEKVILGGQLIFDNSPILTETQKYVDQSKLTNRQTSVVRSSFRDDAGVIAAASIAFKKNIYTF